MMGEVWRDVPSLSGIFVSSEGRVMYAPHRGLLPNGGTRSYGGEPTFGVWNKIDHRFIIPVRGKTYKVHRLIAEAFYGPPPFGAVAMHLDENSANNRAVNIKWGSQKENLNAPGFLEYCAGRTGENNPRVKGQKDMAF
jgi:HNH endonuclease